MKQHLDNIEIVAKLKLGLTPAETAKLVGVAESTVERIRNAAVEKGLLRERYEVSRTHEERAILRKEIAEWVAANNATIAEAANHFHVSEPQVSKSCREHNVEPRRSERAAAKKGVSQLAVLTLLIDGMKQAEVADHFGVSRNYVNIVVDKARKAGVFESVARAVERALRPDKSTDRRKEALNRLRAKIHQSRSESG